MEARLGVNYMWHPSAYILRFAFLKIRAVFILVRRRPTRPRNSAKMFFVVDKVSETLFYNGVCAVQLTKIERTCIFLRLLENFNFNPESFAMAVNEMLDELVVISHRFSIHLLGIRLIVQKNAFSW